MLGWKVLLTAMTCVGEGVASLFVSWTCIFPQLDDNMTGAFEAGVTAAEGASAWAPGGEFCVKAPAPWDRGWQCGVSSLSLDPMKWLPVVLTLALLLPCPGFGQELTIEAIQAGLAAKKDAFQEIKIAGDGKAADFDLKLGESTVKLGEEQFDGFRFTAPEVPEGADFVWYFNAPGPWGNWYILPVEGKPGQAFRNWLDGDKLYEPFDKGGEKERVRILQTLRGDYFTKGAEYLMWFRKTSAGEDGSLRGRAAFAKKKDAEGSWDHDEIEKALKLKPAAVEEQVASLNSTGGLILLDKDSFEPGYAKERIDSAFFSIRSTKRMSGGFFITTQTFIPPCKTTPSFAAIVKKHGEPDFSRSGEEQAKRMSHSGGTPIDDDDKKVTVHYYDYFGFEVETGAKEPKVLRVVTQGTNYSKLRAPAKGASYAQADLENLTVFHQDGKEVGRAYYFLEGGKDPLFIKEPPAGAYESDGDVLTAKGKGKWTWESKFQDGKIARKMLLEDNRLHGKAEGFYPNGKPQFTAEYKKGELHGEVVQYDEAGKEQARRKFKDGKPEGEEE